MSREGRNKSGLARPCACESSTVKKMLNQSTTLHSSKTKFLLETFLLVARLSFRLDFIIEIIAASFISLSGLLFILFVFWNGSVTSLSGWSREQILFIYGYSLLPTTLFQLVAPNLYRFSEKYIVEGAFDRILLRPMNSIVQILTETFNIESLITLPIAIVILRYAGLKLGISFEFLDCLWIAISAISGAVLLIAIFIIVSSFSFHFEDRFGITPPFYNFITFGRYPISIYNKTIQVILTWIIPYAFTCYYPVTYFFSEQAKTSLTFLSPIVAIIVVMIASYIWKIGVNKYSSTGS